MMVNVSLSAIEAIADGARGVVESVSVCCKDSMDSVDSVDACINEMEVTCYLSFEADVTQDQDDIGDVFQAMIDALCVDLVDNATLTQGSMATHLQFMFPGAVCEEDMYERGDRACIRYAPGQSFVTVEVLRSGCSTGDSRDSRDSRVGARYEYYI